MIMTIILAAMLRYSLWDAIVWMRRLLPAGWQAAQKKSVNLPQYLGKGDCPTFFSCVNLCSL